MLGEPRLLLALVHLPLSRRFLLQEEVLEAKLLLVRVALLPAVRGEE